MQTKHALLNRFPQRFNFYTYARYLECDKVELNKQILTHAFEITFKMSTGLH